MQRSICSIVILSLVTTAFLADVLDPESLIGVWLYLAGMCLTFLPSLRDQSGALATFCSGLLLFGGALRFPGIGISGELAGRAVALYAIWTTAAYCHKALLLHSRGLRERAGDNRSGSAGAPSCETRPLPVPPSAHPELVGSVATAAATQSKMPLSTDGTSPSTSLTIADKSTGTIPSETS